jgi:hypothetical protein
MDTFFYIRQRSKQPSHRSGDALGRQAVNVTRENLSNSGYRTYKGCLARLHWLPLPR